MSDGLLVYAITESGACGRPSVPGVGGAPVYGVQDDETGLEAVVSEDGSASGSPAEAVAFHAVVTCLFQRHAILPARFGTRFTGADALKHHLREHASIYTAGLDSVRGHVEVAVRFPVPGAAAEAASGPASSGKAFLEGRSAVLAAREQAWRRAEAVAQDVRKAVPDHVAHTRLERDSRAQGGPVLRLHALMLPEAVDRFRLTTEAIARGLDVVLTGPWPPYDFASRLPGGQAQKTNDEQTVGRIG